MNLVVYCNIKCLLIFTKILMWNFLNSIDIFICSRGLYSMALYFSVLILWFIEFVKKFHLHRMGWIVQKWPTIPIYMSKFYTIKCCQAFLDDTLSLKSHCLYGYSYFCGLEHSKSHCFSCQLTKINFGVPIQIMCYLFY